MVKNEGHIDRIVVDPRALNDNDNRLVSPHTLPPSYGGAKYNCRPTSPHFKPTAAKMSTTHRHSLITHAKRRSRAHSPFLTTLTRRGGRYHPRLPRRLPWPRTSTLAPQSAGVPTREGMSATPTIPLSWTSATARPEGLGHCTSPGGGTREKLEAVAKETGVFLVV